MRAAGGLDRASLEPQERNCRRPRANLVTTRGDGTIVEFSSTAAIRSPFTSPDVEHTDRRPQATMRFLLSIRSLVGDTRDNVRG